MKKIIPITTLLLLVCMALFAQTVNIKAVSTSTRFAGSASFEPGPLMNVPRMGHVAITLPDGRTGFFGGHTTNFVALNTSEIWTPGNTTPVTLTMNYYHSWPVFVLLNDGRYLLAGGCSNIGIPKYATSEIFNPSNTSFTAVGNMVRFRSSMNSGGTAMSDGKVLIAGAWWTHNNAHTYGELFSPNTNNFSAVGPFEAARSHVVVMPTGDGKAVVVGGRTATGNSTQQIMELYDPGTGSISTIQTELFSDDPDWVVSSDLRPTGVQKMEDGRYIWLAYKIIDAVFHYRLLVFDPATKTISHFETIPPLPTSEASTRFYRHPVVDTERNRIHLMATSSGASYPIITIFSVDLSTGILIQLENSFNPGYYIDGADINLLQDGRLMISGGSSANTNFTPVRNTLLIDLEFTSIPSQVALIPQGWSGLSSYIIPNQPAIEDVFAPISNELIIAQTMNEMFYPGQNINTIGNWVSHSAYKIKTNSACSLSIVGAFETDMSVSLNAGWNLLPVVTPNDVDAANLLTFVNGFVIAKDVAGTGVFWPQYNINTIGNLLPGKAYYVMMTAPGVVDYTKD